MLASKPTVVFLELIHPSLSGGHPGNGSDHVTTVVRSSSILQGPFEVLPKKHIEVLRCCYRAR